MSTVIPEDIWHTHILPHVSNNVYDLQRLRAVNRGFRDVVDTRVMKLVETIREHTSQSTPPDVEIDVTEDEVATTEKAAMTGADWILLGCVAEKRWRQQLNTEKYKIFRASTCDMQGKSFMHYWTATICGKYAGGGAYPTGFKMMVNKMLMRDNDSRSIRSSYMKQIYLTYARVRNAWIEIMMEKLKHDIPAHYDKVHTCLLYTSPSPRDKRQSRMPSSA